MPRALWSGAISFGLVNIPIKMFSATRDLEVRFHMLHRKDGGRVHQRLYCAEDDVEVTRDEIVKGYQLSRDRYVTVTGQELKALEPKATRAIEITDFVKEKQIDPIYFQHPYYLLPDEKSERPYTLLVEAMKDSGRIGIGKLVMRDKEYLAALRPLNGRLLLETMRFSDEVVTSDEMELPEGTKPVSAREKEMARQLIDMLSSDFDPSKYRDEYREKVMDLIEKKAKGEKVETPKRPEPGKVINLMTALQKSLDQARSKSGAAKSKPAKKSARKGAAAKRKVS